MAGRIPSEFIDQVLGRTDIVEVVSSRLPLKKAGKDFQALCPFHTEKSPSFTVSQDKQFYHCFGCGAHGSAIGFLMDYEHMGFPEAVEELASRAGLELPRDGAPQPVRDLEPAYRIMEQADRFFRHQLRSHPEAGRAVDYLKGRGVSGEIAAEFGIGYAPPGWDGLISALGKDAGARQQLVHMGLVAEQAHKQYDRFRDRVMFPIRDRRGRTIAFGGRVLGDEKPKYLNSPETPLFHKGRELYGLFEARRALRHVERLLIVEGYMDVIALAQFGIRYAVATLGTATTADHLEGLFRVCREVVFCFDGDQAGRNAAWKALNIAVPTATPGRRIRFLFLPEHEDPDTFVRKQGREELESQVDGAQPMEEFIEQHARDEISTRGLGGPAYLIEAVRPILAKLPLGIVRDALALRLADIAGVDPVELGLKAAGRSQTGPRNRAPAPQRMTPVRWAIAILLQRPALATTAATLPRDWQQLRIPGIELLAQLLDLTASQPNLITAAIIERWRGSEHFVALNALASFGLTGADEDAGQELIGALERLNHKAREQETEHLYSKSRVSDLTDEEKDRLKRLLSRSEHSDSPIVRVDR